MLCRYQLSARIVHSLGQRLFSTTIRLRNAEVPVKDGKKLSPQEAKIEAARLAMQSLKDMGSLFSSGNNDAVQPIDTAPVFEEPLLFAELSLLHKGQVLEELQQKMDHKWAKLTEQDKKLAYYIFYGNWGPREKFANWNDTSAPLDLPFTVPSLIRTSAPQSNDLIKQLEPVILGETEVRKEQFETSKIDPVTKTIIYITIFVAMVALARDKNTGEKGKPVEPVIEDLYVKKKEEEGGRQEALEEASLKKSLRRWYYLWLK